MTQVLERSTRTLEGMKLFISTHPLSDYQFCAELLLTEPGDGTVRRIVDYPGDNPQIEIRWENLHRSHRWPIHRTTLERLLALNIIVADRWIRETTLYELRLSPKGEQAIRDAWLVSWPEEADE